MRDRYINLVKSKARQYSKKYNVPYEEFLGVGLVVLEECLKHYDGKRKFSAFLWGTLRNTFTKAAAVWHEIIPFPDEESADAVYNADLTNYIEHNYAFLEVMLTLSDEAKEMIEVLFEAPPEVMITPPKMIRGWLRDTLFGMGWSRGRYTNAKHEIKQALVGV